MPPCLQDRPAIPPVSCFHPGPVTDQGARLKIRTRFSHSSGSMFQRALTTKDTPEGAVQSESNTTSDDDDDDKEQTMQANVARQRLFCIECGSGFQSGKDLADHVRVHHTASSGHQSVSLHVCTTCSKAFQRSGDLKKHNRFHTGERPFQCTICTKSFHQSGHLKNHIRIHTNERPFACHVCRRGFRQSCNLKRHMKTHAPPRTKDA
ncbi:C2H2-type domain-containing protein [Plasmodiophora brassicae]|uniref:C2H2-type domain-containing protein n=1 Tax=Plasmodiophora brassicae TaxID=37360 RepID=A0A0G4IQ33_PLABS|nr:hypothetical protein PBRA_000606 [Plasmodiophora brassicae]SPQ97567.1 unnamed protein product [Plasmodiophora brassicae]